MFEEKYVDHRRVYVFKPARRFKNVLGFLGRFFSRRNLVAAFRAVTRGFGEYLPFFASCFLVQLIFWSGMIYSDVKLQSAKDEAYASADCHVIVDGLNGDERAAVENGRLWISSQLSPSDRMYESYYFEEYTTAVGEKKYEMHIILDVDSRERADDFISYYQVRGADTHTYYTERITLIEDAESADRVGRAAFFLLALAFASGALTILFNIRTNHYKFRYGIYMSFGAGFEKLFETASWELFMISIFTFIPAGLVGFGATALIYPKRAVAFPWRLSDLWLAILFDLCMVFAATALPIFLLSKKTPVSLLSAEDNSNLVSSPRRSAYIFGKRFPVAYELYGMLRFRKYFAGLLVGAISFSTVFLCGIFLSDRREDIDSAPTAQFSVAVGGEIDEADLSLAAETENVDYIMWDVSEYVSAERGHVVLTNAESGSRDYNTARAADGESIATNSAKYRCIDGALIDTVMSTGAWKVEGDLGSVLNDKYTVAVSEYIYNGRELNFKVGDKITAAVFKSKNAPIDNALSDARLILEQEIKYGNFEYIELTVGAVIDTGTAEDAFTIGVCSELYTELTGKTPAVTSVSVYLSDGLDAATADSVFEDLRRVFSYYSEYTISDNNADTLARLRERTNIRGVTLLCLAAVLMLSPLVWFFSQSMFFSKRRGELYMLGAFGASDSDIRSLHLFSGGATAAAAFAVSILLGGATGYLSFWLLDGLLPKYGFTEAVRHDFGLSMTACAICLCVSAACGFASAYMPYRKFISERDRITRTQLGE